MKLGALLLLGVLAVSGCKKDDDDTATPAPTPTPAPSYPVTGRSSFSATVNGSAVLFQDSVGGLVNRQSWFSWVNPTSLESKFYDAGDDLSRAAITIGKLTYAGSAPTQAELQAFFSLGSKPYYSLTSMTGVTVSVPTSFTQPWGSDFGIQPAGSNFTVTDMVPVIDGSGIPKVKVRATFNCTLFNGSGGSRTLTNGIFVGIFAITS